MNKVIVLCLIFWIACGAFNWSVMLGFWGTRFPPARDHYGDCFVLALTGPFGVPAALGVSNLMEHGYRWR